LRYFERALCSLLLVVVVVLVGGLAAAQDAIDDSIEDEEADADRGPPAGVEVFRVRERKLSAIETDVPESVTSFDATQLEALGATNISDLSKVTPNVEIVTGTATQATFFIRGVGLQDFSSNSTGAVSIMQDRVSVNAPPLQLGQLFDIEMVDVLRGPQSFGSTRNASAGAIKVTTVKPTGYHNAFLRASLGSWLSDSPDTHTGLIQDYEGALEVPIVDELLSTRWAFRFRDADPYATNSCGLALPKSQRSPRLRTGGPSVALASQCGERNPFNMLPIQGFFSDGISLIPEDLPTRVGDEHNWALRGQFRLVPEDSEMDWLLNLHGSRLDQQSTLGQAIGTGRLLGAPGQNLGGALGSNTSAVYWEPDQRREWEGLCDRGTTNQCQNADGAELADEFAETLASGRPLDERPYRGDYNRVGNTTLDTWGGFLTGDIGVGNATLRTVTAFDQFQRTVDQDTDFTPEIRFESENADQSWQFWQELGAKGELENTPLRWDVGGYYFMEDLEFNGQLLTGTAVTSAARDYTQDIRSFAFWGSFAWDFLDDFTLEGGVRYNWEHKDFFFVRSFPLSPGDGLTRTFEDDKTWQAPTGGLSLSYRFSDRVSTYAKYSRGFKPGHYNALSSEPQDARPAREEYLDAFEVGLRGSWWDDRIGFTNSFFYYIYQDYQVFLFTTIPNAAPVLEVVNAEEVENYGAEIELRLEPLAGFIPEMADGLVIDFRFAWLESQFIDFQNQSFLRNAQGNVFPVVEDYTGNRLPNSPEFSVSGAATWRFDFGRWGALTPRYDFTWTDDVYFDPNEGQGAFRQDGRPRLPEDTIGQAAFALHNIRLSYQAPSGNMELSVWCRNLTDEVYKNFAFDASRFSSSVINFLGKPRTIGADLSFSF